VTATAAPMVADPHSIDSRAFRAVLGRFATGIIVVSARVDGTCYAMTANAFMSGSLEPPLIVIAVGHRAKMHRVLGRVDAFGVSILTQDQEPHSRHFAGQPDAMCRPRFKELAGVPVLADGAAYLKALIVHRYNCGDHTLLVGSVEALEMEQEVQDPLLFYSGRYAKLVSTRPVELGSAPDPLPFFY